MVFISVVVVHRSVFLFFLGLSVFLVVFGLLWFIRNLLRFREEAARRESFYSRLMMEMDEEKGKEKKEGKKGGEDGNNSGI